MIFGFLAPPGGRGVPLEGAVRRLWFLIIGSKFFSPNLNWFQASEQCRKWGCVGQTARVLVGRATVFGRRMLRIREDSVLYQRANTKAARGFASYLEESSSGCNIRRPRTVALPWDPFCEGRAVVLDRRMPRIREDVERLRRTFFIKIRSSFRGTSRDRGRSPSRGPLLLNTAVRGT